MGTRAGERSETSSDAVHFLQQGYCVGHATQGCAGIPMVVLNVVFPTLAKLAGQC